MYIKVPVKIWDKLTASSATAILTKTQTLLGYITPL